MQAIAVTGRSAGLIIDVEYAGNMVMEHSIVVESRTGTHHGQVIEISTIKMTEINAKITMVIESGKTKWLRKFKITFCIPGHKKL